jgi:hypothetical protein
MADAISILASLAADVLSVGPSSAGATEAIPARLTTRNSFRIAERLYPHPDLKAAQLKERPGAPHRAVHFGLLTAINVPEPLINGGSSRRSGRRRQDATIGRKGAQR